MKKYLFLPFCLIICGFANAQQLLSELNNEQRVIYEEHVFGGQPDNEKILIRNAYVVNYNTEWRIPNWCAYHITSDYLNTPERKSRFKRFRDDPDIEKPVNESEYDGLLSSLGYARGHYAPFKILGGDRDNDGTYAQLQGESDEDDEITVFEGNYMSNIAPQLHYGFNGSGGLWFKTERWVQDKVVSDAVEVWEYSGGIIHDDRHIEKVGINNDIAVPDQFYKVVIKKGENEYPDVLVFLFPHNDHKDDVQEKDIFKYLVSVDYLEAISGLDFFQDYSSSIQKQFESSVDINAWAVFID